jgi:hypothetical protein
VLIEEAISRLQQLADDRAGLMLYRSGQLVQYSVGQLAQEGLARIEQRVKG